VFEDRADAETALHATRASDEMLRHTARLATATIVLAAATVVLAVATLLLAVAAI
jgi:hypothetical protein